MLREDTEAETCSEPIGFFDFLTNLSNAKSLDSILGIGS